MIEDWLKFKKYPHIGEPLSSKRDKYWIIKYVSNPDNIINHKFVPLIHKTIKLRKYRPLSGASKNKSGKRERSIDKKEREIYYMSHLDSIIYAYYNFLLSNKYEEFLSDKPYSPSIVAYRKIPIHNDCKNNKCNIEFAFDAFNYVHCNKDKQLSIIITDITSFFDNLNHRILHSQWKRVIGTNNLPEDHYAIFKNLINIKFVNEFDLYMRFKDKLYVERYKPNDTSQKTLRQKRINDHNYLRRENVVAYCSKKDFFKYATDLIRTDKPNNNNKREQIGKDAKRGIPQGTPISATLANLYMIDFDELIYNITSSVDRPAFYQRYSDDIILICERKDEEFYYDLLLKEINECVKLDIKKEKTKIYRYETNSDMIFSGGLYNPQDNSISSNKHIEYLGFTYNGSKVYIKNACFSKFYRNMKHSFKRGAHFAKQNNSYSGKLFEHRLYKRYTYIGSKRRLIWKPNKNNPSEYVCTKTYDWGNLISYIYKANKIMLPINNDDSILRQIRKIWENFHKIKKNTYEEINKSLKKQQPTQVLYIQPKTEPIVYSNNVIH